MNQARRLIWLQHPNKSYSQGGLNASGIRELLSNNEILQTYTSKLTIGSIRVIVGEIMRQPDHRLYNEYNKLVEMVQSGDLFGKVPSRDPPRREPRSQLHLSTQDKVNDTPPTVSTRHTESSGTPVSAPPVEFKDIFSPGSLLPLLLSYLDNKTLVSLTSTSQTARDDVQPVLNDRFLDIPVSISSWSELKNHDPNMRNLVYSGEEHLGDGVLPASLTHLTFGDEFNHPIGVGVLPASLTHLTFGDEFNHPIDEGVLPASLTHLTFGEKFNQPIGVGVLPPSLTHLTFGKKFNQKIERDVLPPSLTHLTFGERFNHPIDEDVLPAWLTHLEFGKQFKHPINEDVLKIVQLTQYKRQYG